MGPQDLEDHRANNREGKMRSGMICAYLLPRQFGTTLQDRNMLNELNTRVARGLEDVTPATARRRQATRLEDRGPVASILPQPRARALAGNRECLVPRSPPGQLHCVRFLFFATALWGGGRNNVA